MCVRAVKGGYAAFILFFFSPFTFCNRYEKKKPTADESKVWFVRVSS